MNVDLKALARLGAQIRLAELVTEMDALLRQFPGLAKQGQAQPVMDAEQPGKPKARKRRRMTAEQRQAASKRMRAYWKARKERLGHEGY